LTLPGWPGAVLDNAAASGADAAAARRKKPHLTLQTHVNGHGTYDFLVNGGVDASMSGEAKPLDSSSSSTSKIRKARPAPRATPSLPRLPPAALDDTLAVGGDDVKAREIDTRLSVEVLINGTGPYRFLVDSGADSSVVGLSIARHLKLQVGAPAILYGMTDQNLVDRVKVSSLTLGSSTIKDVELPALREADLGGSGIIGIDALVHRRLMMDFEKRVIKVEDARKPPKPMPGEIVVVGKRRRGQLILTHVKAGRVALDAVIDTGAEVTVGNLALRDNLVRRRQKFQSVSVVGVTGKIVEMQVAIIPRLEIGPIVVHDVPVAFADLLPFHVFGIANDPALFVGTDLLQLFRRVSLDFDARKVRFQLRRCKPDSDVVTIPLGLPTATRAHLCG
jgi:predicted aspartyl protease